MSQTVTTTSWSSRLVNSLIGMLFGFALVAGSFWFIFWNEKNGLHQAQSLHQTQQVVISIPIKPIDKNNELKVIYLSGLATTEDILSDDILNFKMNAIRLNRDVKMFQWKQNKETTTEKNTGGSETQTTTYTYETVWSNDLISSKNFQDPEGHQNPATKPFNSKQKDASKVTIGDFIIPYDLVSKMTLATPIDLAGIDTSNIQKYTDLKISHNDTDIYLGENSKSPQVGDVRIHVTAVLPQTVSIIAQQIGNTMQPYMAPAGLPIALLYPGQLSSAQIIRNAEIENQKLIWLYRGLSLLAMIIAIALILAPVSVLADVIPFFGNIVEFGSFLIAVVVGTVLWTIGFAIAWFVVRPLLAVGMVVAVIVIGYGLLHRKKQNLNNAG